MCGHPSEHLFWAPDPRDDFAFTLYATDIEELREAKSQMIEGLLNGSIAAQSSFEEFQSVMEDTYPVSKHFSFSDWEDVRNFW